MEKIRPQDLKQPDIFVTEVNIIWQWAHKHQKVLSIIVGALLLTGIGYSGFELFDGSREQKSQEALFQAMHTYGKKRDAFDKADKPKKAAAKNPNKKAGEDDADDAQDDGDPSVVAEKSTGDLEKDYGVVARDLEKVAVEQMGTKASVVAALTVSEIYRDYKQPEKGLKILSEVSKKLPHNDVLKGTVALNIGDFYQMKGECDRAVQEWENIVKEVKYNFLKPEALLREALCFRVSGQVEKSTDLLKKLSTDQETSSSRAGQAAKKYLRLQAVPETPTTKKG